MTAVEQPDTSAFAAHPIDELRKLCHPRVILDCGAGEGFFAQECLKAFPDAEVHSFEPVKALFANLSRAVSHAHCVALGNEDGQSVINLTTAPKSNSLLGFLPGNPLQEHLRVVGTEPVTVRRLDSFLEAHGINAADVGLLKMDVQGYELKLLEGCPKLLAHRPVIIAEVAFQQQYRDQPLIVDIDEFLAARGYRRHCIYGSSLPEIWGDAIYVPCDSGIRLNIGAGKTRIPGWTPIDRKLGTEAFPLNYADNSVEEIRASHILEHFSFREVPQALEEWKRVLKPGGKLRVSVPDFQKIVAHYDDDPSWAYVLMGGQQDSDDFHRSVFDERRLAAHLRNAGLVNINHWESPNTDTASHKMSLNLEAVKPEAGEPESLTIGIKAVMSVPRIGWNNARQTIDASLGPLNIPLETFDGVFWGQCMQRAFEHAVEEGCDWVLALDYDSMITPQLLGNLLQTFGSNAHIDALAAMQMRRGQDYPLMTIAGKTEAEVPYEPMKVHTAHFGLTLLRVDSLKKVPKPWFASKPDENGEWGDNRLDDDIWFWHQWRLAGNNIYVDPGSRIGHLELMVSEFDENMQPCHMHLSDWRKKHFGERAA